MSVLFNLKSEKVFATVGSYCLKMRTCFMLSVFMHVFFWPLEWLSLKKNFFYIWFSWSFSCNSFLSDFRLKRAGHLNGWVPLIHLDRYHFKWKRNSSSTLSKRHIIDTYLFLSFLYFINNFRIFRISEL